MKWTLRGYFLIEPFGSEREAGRAGVSDTRIDKDKQEDAMREFDGAVKPIDGPAELRQLPFFIPTSFN